MPRRLTNDLLLGLVLALVLSGLFGWALPVAVAQPLYDLHRALGVAVLLVLLIWKQAVIRASLSRRLLRARRWDRSTVWGLFGIVGLTGAVIIGVLWTLNIISFETLWGYSPLNIHVLIGIGLLPFVGWHVWRRRKANRASAPVASRRAALRVAGLVVASTVGWQVLQVVANLAIPNGQRRLTGSKQATSLSANNFPGEIWLFDSVPLIDANSWRLHLSGPVAQPVDLSLYELQRRASRTIQEVLDCTGGWWTEQVWRGYPLHTLLQLYHMLDGAEQVAVQSITGHRIVFSPDDLEGLLLVTHVGGEPLAPVHGAPVRLVAPGRRGYQWVKWIDRVEVT